MLEINGTKIYGSQIAKYSRLENAKNCAITQRIWTDVVLGDDGLFWVPRNRKVQGLLIKGGYSLA